MKKNYLIKREIGKYLIKLKDKAKNNLNLYNPKVSLKS